MRLKGDKDNACQGILEEKNSTSNAEWTPVKYSDGGNINADDTCSKLRCGKSQNLNNSGAVNLTCTGKLGCTSLIPSYRS